MSSDDYLPPTAYYLLLSSEAGQYQAARSLLHCFAYEFHHSRCSRLISQQISGASRLAYFLRAATFSQRLFLHFLLAADTARVDDMKAHASLENGIAP